MHLPESSNVDRKASYFENVFGSRIAGIFVTVYLNRLNSTSQIFRYYLHNRNKCAAPCIPTNLRSGWTAARIFQPQCETLEGNYGDLD